MASRTARRLSDRNAGCWASVPETERVSAMGHCLLRRPCNRPAKCSTGPRRVCHGERGPPGCECVLLLECIPVRADADHRDACLHDGCHLRIGCELPRGVRLRAAKRVMLRRPRRDRLLCRLRLRRRPGDAGSAQRDVRITARDAGSRVAQPLACAARVALVPQRDDRRRRRRRGAPGGRRRGLGRRLHRRLHEERRRGLLSPSRVHGGGGELCLRDARRGPGADEHGGGVLPFGLHDGGRLCVDNARSVLPVRRR
mmetsp:Transcript_15692/g.48652  ORF Transcript_15692/g.48652 Transcript_15692/m.48652 type:complete len:256 (+) Transcript_15692:240-1007(+)